MRCWGAVELARWLRGSYIGVGLCVKASWVAAGLERSRQAGGIKERAVLF
jgi:hypothetical protein